MSLRGRKNLSAGSSISSWAEAPAILDDTASPRGLSFRSGHRFELEYILGPFCERISKKCGHASLSAKILHNLLSLRSGHRSYWLE